MKKILLTILGALLLISCAKINNTPSAEVDSTPKTSEFDDFTSQTVSDAASDAGTYNNKEFNISFKYPSNWELADSQVVQKLDRVDNEVYSQEEKFEHSVVLKTGDKESIFFDYESMSFDEYESYKQPEGSGDSEIGGFSIEEITMANYPAKKYTEWGVELAGISYIIEKNGKFLMFITESGFNEEQKVGIEEILNSLEFK
ncbi:hypothetical protein KKC94_04165 [Patescibacteria group bacterium]|nr:hypothetical protein [Patescibacteria group bacterium]